MVEIRNCEKRTIPNQNRETVNTMTAIPKPWTRARRCPVCRKAGCLVSSPTDPSAAICTRTASSQAIGNIGHLHILRDGPPWARGPAA